MARTADMNDFAGTGGRSRLRGLAKAWNGYMWAREAHALLRIEREAGYLFDDQTLSRLKARHLARKPR